MVLCRSNTTMLCSLLCTKPCSRITVVFFRTKAYHLTNLVLHGDISPWFPCCTAYFDLSVRSTTLSAIISSASCQARVAAAAEVAKDTKINARTLLVIVVEILFLWFVRPLVFGLLLHVQSWGQSWTGQLLGMVALQVSKTPVSCQLSVTLWKYNAKMILCQH